MKNTSRGGHARFRSPAIEALNRIRASEEESARTALFQAIGVLYGRELTYLEAVNLKWAGLTADRARAWLADLRTAMDPVTLPLALDLVVETLTLFLAREPASFERARGARMVFLARELATRGSESGGLSPTGTALRRLAKACARTSQGRRDRAILTLIYSHGLKPSAAVALDLNDGAGTRGRIASLDGHTRIDLRREGGAGLEEWIAVRGSEPGPFLLPFGRFGIGPMRRLTTEGIRCALRSLAKQAQIPGELARPEALRHARRAELSEMVLPI